MKKVVIIGGGFAGVYAAKHLENKFKVVLIDSKDYFEYTPGILRTIVDPNHIKKIQLKHSSYLKKTIIILGSVTKINEDSIIIENKSINFDYLLICSGSSYNLPFKEQNSVIANRADNLYKYHNKLLNSKKIVIVGGGIVGVELAGEITDKYKDKEVSIIQGYNKLIERENNKTVNYVANFLLSRKVKIIYNELALSYKKKKVKTNKGSYYDADIVFLATGIIPNTDFIDKKYLDDKKFIKVNEYLQVGDFKNIFAVGDVNNVDEEKLAQNAEEQSKVAVCNIEYLENNKPLKKYNSVNRNIVISLGKYNGVITNRNFTIFGLLPALLKQFIEKREIFKFKH